MSDIQLDTPLGNGMAEILSWAKEARRCAGRRHEVEVTETIIALCDALETYEANLRALAEESAKDIREAREENEKLRDALVKARVIVRESVDAEPVSADQRLDGLTLRCIDEALRSGGEEEK